MFFTLTFPADKAPDETEAQRCWRALVRRLRYRGLLSEYGFVLQRTKRGVLHVHGIGYFEFMRDDLAEWRRLLQASGFGVQNRLVIANPAHAGYVTRYIATGLAELAPMRRAYSFSRSFPEAPAVVTKRRIAEVGDAIGLRPECEWTVGLRLT